MHYEKFPDGAVKCIEDEIPFELPEGWGRLYHISEIVTGSTPNKKNPEYYGGDFPFLSQLILNKVQMLFMQVNIYQLKEKMQVELY